MGTALTQEVLRSVGCVGRGNEGLMSPMWVKIIYPVGNQGMLSSAATQRTDSNITCFLEKGILFVWEL